MTTSLLRHAVLATAILLLCAACADRDAPSLVYSYQKTGMSEQNLLDDEQQFENTSGVTKVIGHFDKGRVLIELYVDETNKIPGLEKAQQLGYQQVGN